MKNTGKIRRFEKGCAIFLAVVMILGMFPQLSVRATEDTDVPAVSEAVMFAAETILSAPQNLAVVDITSYSATLNWDAPETVYADGGDVTYTVRWAREGGELVTRTGIADTTFEVRTLHFDALYSFRVYAVQDETMSQSAGISAWTHAPSDHIWDFEDVHTTAWELWSDTNAEGFFNVPQNQTRWVAQHAGGSANIGAVISGAHRPNSIENFRGNAVSAGHVGFVTESGNTFLRLSRPVATPSTGGSAILNIPQFEPDMRGEIAVDVSVDGNNSDLFIQLIQSHPTEGARNTRRLGRIMFGAENQVTFATNNNANTTDYTSANPAQVWVNTGSGAVDTSGRWITFRFIYDFSESPTTLAAAAINPDGTIVELGAGMLPEFADGYRPNRIVFGHVANALLSGNKDFDNLRMGFEPNANTGGIANDVPVTGLTMEPGGHIQMIPGSFTSLVASPTPLNAFNAAVDWSSGDTDVVSVDANGRVTAIGGGTATITARLRSDANITATIEIEVVAQIIKPITFNHAHVIIPLGESWRLREDIKPISTLDPLYGDYIAPTLTSDNEAVARIINNGFIHAQSIGTATITGVRGTDSGSVTVEVRAQNDFERIRRNLRNTFVPYEIDVTDPDAIRVMQENDVVANELLADMNRTFTDDAAGWLWPVGDRGLMHGAAQFTNMNPLARALSFPGSVHYMCPDLFDTVERAMQWLLDNAFRCNFSSTQSVAVWNQLYPPGHPEREQVRSAGTVNLSGNWWHREIYTSDNSVNILTLLADLGFCSELIERYGRRLNIYNPDSVNRATGGIGTPSHQAYKTFFITMEGVLRQDEARFRQGIATAFTGNQVNFNPVGDGFHWDGSLIGHTFFASTLAYGINILESVIRTLAAVDGETFMGEPITFNQNYDQLMEELLAQTYLPSIWRGVVMPSLGGRSVGRERFTIADIGVARVMYTLLPSFPEYMQPIVREHLKAWVTHSPELMSGRNLHTNAGLRAIYEDAGVAAIEGVGIYAHNMQGRTFYRGADFAFGLAINNRNANRNAVTAGNGENWRGAFTGDGMTYLHLNNDHRQFSDNFFHTVDSFRMPGTTVEVQDGWGFTGFTNQLSGTGGPNSGANNQHTMGATVILRPTLAGGGLAAPVGEVAVTSFRQNMMGANPSMPMDNTANKSWFMIDGRILALGTNITSTTGAPVVTTIAQHRVSEGVRSFVLNGALINAVSGVGQAHGPASNIPSTGTDFQFATRFAPTHIDGNSWAHLEFEGSSPRGGTAQVGWFIPDGGAGNSAAVHSGIETRRGSWHEINIRYYTTVDDINYDDYANLFINHGANPVADSYEYVILPNATRDEVQAFAAAQTSDAPIYEVLYASETLHAVYDFIQNILMVVNFANNPAEVTSPVTGLTYVIPMAGHVLIEEQGISGDHFIIRMAMQDATMSDATMSVRILDSLGIIIEADGNITLTSNEAGAIVTAGQLATFQARRGNSWEALIEVIPMKDIEQPESVQNFAVFDRDYFSATLTWDPPANSEDLIAISYKVTYTFEGREVTHIVPGDQTSLRIFPLLADTLYDFSVVARNFHIESDPVIASARTDDYTPVAVIDFQTAESGDVITDGVLAGNPHWTFNNQGNANNIHMIVDEDGNRVLEVSAPIAGTQGYALYHAPEITEGLMEFSFSARNVHNTGVNAVILRGHINGVERDLARVMSQDDGTWIYEINGGTNTPVAPIDVGVGQNGWVHFRFLVDFDDKLITILINEQVLVHRTQFRYRTANNIDAPSRYPNEAFGAITGFRVLPRSGQAGTIRVDDIYMTAQPLDGIVILSGASGAAVEVGDLLTASYSGRHMGNLIYTWSVNDMVVDDITGSTFVVRDEDVGQTIRVTVTSTHETGSRYTVIHVDGEPPVENGGDDDDGDDNDGDDNDDDDNEVTYPIPPQPPQPPRPPTSPLPPQLQTPPRPEQQPAPTPELPQPPTEYELHLAYMFGDENGNFRPSAHMTRAEVATILARTQLLDFEQGVSVLPPSMTSFTVFPDVTSDNWYFYYVAWAYDAGLVRGDANGFRPNDPITREEFAAMLARTTAVYPAGRVPFGDEARISNWAQAYVYTVHREGWMIGDDRGNFRPAANIGRHEAATAMNRILGRLDSRIALDNADVVNLNLARQFPDVYEHAWYFPSVLGATNTHRLYRDESAVIAWKEIASG
ncbi:MAG: S-layer homology domain-containing protein [Oscillospiraceae bacterium]|nr:S-layer homology domain-containing protein [Oscillospiraceae bacterium]